MPQTPHFLRHWKKISEPVELWPENLFLRPKFQFWASFCKCCRSLQHFSPHWTNVVPQLPNLVSASIWGIILRNVADHSTFLSPPANVVPQMRNLVSKREIGRPIWNLRPQNAKCSPHLTNVVPNMRNLVPKTEIGRPIWNLGTQK